MSNIGKFPRYLKYLTSLIKWPFICENWPLGLVAYLDKGDRNRKVIYHLRNGIKLEAQLISTDFQIIREIFVHNVYFKNFTKSVNPKIILDIGAHKGFAAIHMSNKYPNSIIYSFEPDPVNFSYLEKNLKINDIHNVIALNYAISHKTRNAFLYESAISSVGHSLFLNMVNGQLHKKIKVKCKTLDRVIKELKLNKIDILKMDIEGEEYPVLTKMPSVLLKKIKSILVETHPTVKHKPVELEIFFQKRSFSTYRPYDYENVLVAINEKS